MAIKIKFDCTVLGIFTTHRKNTYNHLLLKERFSDKTQGDCFATIEVQNNEKKKLFHYYFSFSGLKASWEKFVNKMAVKINSYLDNRMCN